MSRKHLLLGLLLIAVGIVFTGFGFVQHGATALVFDRGIHIAKPYHADHRIAGFKRLVFDLNDYDVTIRSGASYRVQVSGTTTTKPRIQLTGKTLRISSGAPHASLQLDAQPQRITITTPGPLTLAQLSGQLGDSNLSLQVPVHAANLNLRLNDGDLQARALATTAGQIAVNDGNARLTSSTLTNLRFTQHDGDLNIADSTVTGGRFASHDGDQTFSAVTLKQVVTLANRDGDVQIHNSPITGYRLTTHDGRIRWFKQTAASQFAHHPDAANRLVIASHDGHITID